MRHRRTSRTRLAVCKSYERLRQRWQSFVDGAKVQSDSQPLDEDAAMNAQQQMVEHRQSCEDCKTEDLALKEGEVHTLTFAESS
jgi:hypothetical protein